MFLYKILKNIKNYIYIYIYIYKLSGAEVARLAHNQKVTGSKPVLAIFFFK